MRSLAATTLALALLLTGCDRPAGPRSPVAPERAAEVRAAPAVAVRVTANAFLDAYAAVPTEGSRSLLRRSGTSWLQGWSFWVGRQFAQLEGSATAERRVRLGTTAPVVQDGKIVPGLWEVALEGELVFTIDDAVEDPQRVVRSVTGPMWVGRTAGGGWAVADFLRDGVPMNTAYQDLEGLSFTTGEGDLDVRVASFLAWPAWQFGVLVRARDRTYSLPAANVTLVDDQGRTVAESLDTSSALRAIDPGRQVAGLIGLPRQDSAEGLVLRMVFQAGPRSAALEVPLEDAIEPIAVPGTASPSP
jgi:hypothetical protein